MPPSLEASLFRERTPVSKQPVIQTRLVFGDGVISRSPDRGQSQNNVKRKTKARTYGQGPLPFKPSQDAPRDARIVGRVAELGKLPYFTLNVGEVEIDDVGLHEILEYVSPYELERFEHRQFVEEREALAAALAAAEIEDERRKERQRERAKRKGISVVEEVDADDADSAEPTSGRIGRARPTYKHLFKLPQERRRRRKRDPITNELLPLSGDELQGVNDIDLGNSEGDLSPDASGPGEAPKRRRRRRDPQTGELMPLPPLPQDIVMRTVRSSPAVPPSAHRPDTPSEHQKRPRRRRHPLTRELMPLGWKYDPNTEQSPYQARRDGKSPSTRKLSTSEEQKVKRVKLASESSADESLRRQRSSSGPDNNISISETAKTGLKPFIHNAQEAGQSLISSPMRPKSTPKTSMLRPTARAASSASSTEPVTLASFLKSSAAGEDDSDSDESLGMPQQSAVWNTHTRGKTSIMQPVAADLSLGSNKDENENDADSSLNEGEWFVEAIVGHKMSDSRSHSGKMSALLYHTKWEGSNELTWEPATSFVDPDTVKAYRVRVGLDKGKGAIAIRSPVRVVPVVTSGHTPKSTPKIGRHEDALVQPDQHPRSFDVETSNDDMDDDMDDDTDDGYEIEAILAHHMSDPRTHPGKPQTMLYKVQWAGFTESEATWEPRTSFPNVEILNAYRQKAGLKPESR